ncbi:MAG TPA: CHAD domain-containing protein [Thermoleophilaceae bacterium]|nr:CHAD domain-containing protein [Thermoleophilaceae bacterium]
MAGAKRIPGLDGDLSFAQAAAKTIQVCASEVFSYADGMLDTSDPERVHDMRVATRRLRTALEIFAPCFPKYEYKPLLREVKALADALGERRDADVQIGALEALGEGLTQADRTGVRGLIAELRDRQHRGNRTLEAALARARDERLEERLAGLAAGGEAP